MEIESNLSHFFSLSLNAFSSLSLKIYLVPAFDFKTSGVMTLVERSQSMTQTSRYFKEGRGWIFIVGKDIL